MHEDGGVASTELSRGHLRYVCAQTAGVADAMTARTMADVVPRCGNEQPDVAALEVDAAGTSARDAATAGSPILSAVRLIGLHAGRWLTATRIADRPGVAHTTGENRRHRNYCGLGVQSQSVAVSVAFLRGLIQSQSPSIRQSRPDLSSNA